MSKDSIVVSHAYSVGCYYYICSLVSYDHQLRRGIAVPRFVYNDVFVGTGRQKKQSV